MRVLFFLVVNAVLVSPIAAQVPFELVSKVESGWTSNASETAGGAADFYLRQKHDLSIRGTTGPLSLRAGLLLDQQTFRQFTGENDLSVTGGVEAGFAMGQGTALRLGYALTQEWTGKMLDLGPLVLTIASPATQHEALAEIIVTGSGRAVTVGVDVLARQPGLSEFAGLPIEPMVIDPQVTLVTARADGEWTMTPELTGLARLHWIVGSVPEADRMDFGREPASVARFAGGLRLRHGALAAQVHAGADAVWPHGAPHMLQFLPYLDASAEWAVSELLTLNARGSAVAGILKPVDGVASQELAGDLGARLVLTDSVSLSLGLAVSRERGLYDESVFIDRRSVNGGVTLALSPSLEAGLMVSHGEIKEPGAVYPVSTIAVTLGGRV